MNQRRPKARHGLWWLSDVIQAKKYIGEFLNPHIQMC
jgi:hypothetical protein